MGGPARSSAWFCLTGAVLITGGGAAALLFSMLAGIENDPAEYASYRAGLQAAVLGAFVALGVVLTALYDSEALPIRRSARRSAVAVFVAALLWYAPVPFGVHRYLLLAVVLSCMALLGLASLRAGGLSPRSAGPLGALGATAGACCVLLQLKLDALAWAAAVD